MALRRLAQALRSGLGTGRDREERLPSDIERLLLAIGRRESRTARNARHEGLRNAEFRIYSQFGEDGIIQYLLGRVPIVNDVFVEFGVGDYRESNTRFLLCNDDWRGLILDGGTAHIEFIKTDSIGWRHWIDARSVFITSENINATIREAGIEGDIGLLSVDIDGNDYWVLDAIEVVSPRILVVEYNSTFGPSALVTVPYDPAFERTAAHPSGLYWGASIAALTLAAERKGLLLVGSNSAGNNAFFVREDVLGDLTPISPAEAWVDARFRESRDQAGALTYLASRRARLDAIADMRLTDVVSGRTVRVTDLTRD